MKGLNGLKIGVTDTVNLEIRILKKSGIINTVNIGDSFTMKWFYKAPSLSLEQNKKG